MFLGCYGYWAEVVIDSTKNWMDGKEECHIRDVLPESCILGIGSILQLVSGCL